MKIRIQTRPRAALLLSTLALLVSLASGCRGISEQGITGELQIQPKTGYSTLDFTDASTKQKFSLAPGRYQIDFKPGILWTDPMIEIKDPTGKIVGRLAVPAKSFNEDGTFEFYGSHIKNENAFNILGGRRKIILNRMLIPKLQADCTYTVSYPCETPCTKTRSDGTSYESMCSDTCTRTEHGNRDELWARETYKHYYRILFDGFDLMNVAQFVGDSATESEDSMLTADSCK